MEQPALAETMHEVAHEILAWIGFGTLVGLLAKALVPGRDPGGPIVTVLLGCGGSIVGSGLLMYFYDGKRVSPLTPLGFLVATAGAFLILLFYRLLAGRIIREDGEGFRSAPGEPHYRQRRGRVYQE